MHWLPQDAYSSAFPCFLLGTLPPVYDSLGDGPVICDRSPSPSRRNWMFKIVTRACFIALLVGRTEPITIPDPTGENGCSRSLLPGWNFSAPSFRASNILQAFILMSFFASSVESCLPSLNAYQDARVRPFRKQQRFLPMKLT